MRNDCSFPKGSDLVAKQGVGIQALAHGKNQHSTSIGIIGSSCILEILPVFVKPVWILCAYFAIVDAIYSVLVREGGSSRY